MEKTGEGKEKNSARITSYWGEGNTGLNYRRLGRVKKNLRGRRKISPTLGTKGKKKKNQKERGGREA